MSLEDKAQEHEAQIWAINNRPREVASYQPGEKGYGPEDCEECGADMHPVRRAHGFKVCTPCASALESKTSGRVRR